MEVDFNSTSLHPIQLDTLRHVIENKTHLWLIFLNPPQINPVSPARLEDRTQVATYFFFVNLGSMTVKCPVCVRVWVCCGLVCLTVVSSLAQTPSMAALQTSLSYKSIMLVLLQQLWCVCVCIYIHNYIHIWESEWYFHVFASCSL